MATFVESIRQPSGSAEVIQASVTLFSDITLNNPLLEFNRFIPDVYAQLDIELAVDIVQLVLLRATTGPTGASIYLFSVQFQDNRVSPVGRFQGQVGPTGVMGFMGVFGYTGSVATTPSGPFGYIGFLGLRGPVGFTGVPGPGITGPAGPPGIQGPLGPFGPQGTAGITGVTGPVGPTGSAGPVLTQEVIITSGTLSTSLGTFTRMGGRKLDLSPFLSSIGGLPRHIQFIADLQKSSGASSVEVQLFDVTDAVLVAGTSILSTNNSLTEVSSGDLTVGSSPGNLRNDAPKLYEVNVRMNGGGPTDEVFITNARLLIFYA